ncbi:MAG TPA: hypothetical protein VIV60_34970 [Polyangiaceae bacterium]
MSGTDILGVTDKIDKLGKLGSPAKAVAQEFLVDVLGGLAPGILLIVGTLVCAIPALFAMHFTLNAPAAQASLNWFGRGLAAIGNMSATLMFFVCIGMVLMTYVAGHVFYRRDPKEPDRASFRHLMRDQILADLPDLLAGNYVSATQKSGSTAPGSGASVGMDWKTRLRISWNGKWFSFLAGTWNRGVDPARLIPGRWFRKSVPKDVYVVDLKRALAKNYGAENERECEFPYPTYEQYLTERGFLHLTDWVRWGEHRSKVYINALKIRLMQHYPDCCRQIVHNEAHVRLASGTWYVAGTLRLTSQFSLLLVIGSNAVSARTGIHPFFSGLAGSQFWTLVLILAVLYISGFLRRRIEGFFHYQRMREVLYVLETGFSAFHGDLDALGPPFKRESQSARPSNMSQVTSGRR